MITQMMGTKRKKKKIMKIQLKKVQNVKRKEKK